MSSEEQVDPAAIETDERGVAVLTIRGSGSLNVLGTPAIREVTEAIAQLTGDPAVRVLIVKGAKHFIGGADIKEMSGLAPASAEQFIIGLRGLCDGLRRFPVPVIARISGWCLGGGLEVALACDIRIAGDDARLGMPEVKVGIPSVIHAALLPRLIGDARASWMLLTGEAVDAKEAQAWGLVNRLVPGAELDSEVERVAALFAGYGPAVVRQQKRMLREWQDQPLETSIDGSVAEFGRAFTTGEPQRFMKAFLERKRQG